MGLNIECPVCFKTIMDPPIYVCVNQHIMCDICHETLKGRGDNCPECRRALTNTRNLVIEKILLDHLPQFKCKFGSCNFSKAESDRVKKHQDDCQHRPGLFKCKFGSCNFSKAESDRVKKHEDDCQHRTVTCPICSANLPLSELTSKHATEVHSRSCHQGPGIYFGQIDTWCWAPASEGSANFKSTSMPIFEKGKRKMVTFFTNAVLHEGRYLFWISHNQSKYQTRFFEYAITLRSGKEKDAVGLALRLAKYVGFCQPMDVTVDVSSVWLSLRVSSTKA